MKSAVSVVVFLFAAGAYWYQTHAPHIAHRGRADERHPFHVFNPIWDEAELQTLMTLMRESHFVSTTAAYTPARYEDIGEIEPVQADGTCRSSFMIPNHAKTHCIFPERLDVAGHQILSGGVDVLKEAYATCVRGTALV